MNFYEQKNLQYLISGSKLFSFIAISGSREKTYLISSLTLLRNTLNLQRSRETAAFTCKEDKASEIISEICSMTAEET